MVSLCRQNIPLAAEVGELETGYAGPSSRIWCSVANWYLWRACDLVSNQAANN